MERVRNRKRIVLGWLAGVAFGAICCLVGLLTGELVISLFGAVSGLAVLAFGHRHMRLEPAVPVLAWHSVSDHGEWLPWSDNLTVRPAVFSAQMQALQKLGWSPISSEDLANWLDGTKDIPSKAVVLHFDDGYRDNALAAVPVLRKMGFPATIFVSTDFIAATPDKGWKGYLTDKELRALDADPLIEIAGHGCDHGRLPVPGPSAGTWERENWRFHAALTWAKIPGNKSRWFDAHSPEPFSLGDPIPSSESSLTARAMMPSGELETEDSQIERISAQLSTCRAELEKVLGRPVTHLCWPFDSASPLSVSLAQKAGFQVMTGGDGYNQRTTPKHAIARMHITDYATGGGPLWTEVLTFRAKLEVASGNLYWAPLMWFAALLRRRRFRRGIRPTGAVGEITASTAGTNP